MAFLFMEFIFGIFNSLLGIFIQEFQENIVVEIEFEHSQGFMGFYDPDYLSLEVKDHLLTTFYKPINIAKTANNIDLIVSQSTGNV